MTKNSVGRGLDGPRATATYTHLPTWQITRLARTPTELTIGPRPIAVLLLHSMCTHSVVSSI